MSPSPHSFSSEPLSDLWSPSERQDLEYEYIAITRQRPVVEIVRRLALALVVVGLLLIITGSSQSSTGILSLSVGILTHSATPLLGQDYYLRRAFLARLLGRDCSE